MNKRTTTNGLRILVLLIGFVCFSVLSFARTESYAWTGRLGGTIRFRLELQVNSVKAVAGEMTYYRKDNSIRKIPVYGFTTNEDCDSIYTIFVREHVGDKICGYISVEIKDGRFVRGSWIYDTKDLEMSRIEVATIKPGTQYFHPVTSIDKAVGSYSFTYDSGNSMMPEYGGTCELKKWNGRIRWEMGQVTPNIADGEGVSSFVNSQFSGQVGNYKFKAYVDEKFIYVWRTNPEDGICDMFGAHATLDGIYVRTKKSH